MGALSGNLEVADIEPPFTGLNDRNRYPVKVSLVVRFLEIGVGVAADHKVHVAGPADEHLVKVRFVLETNVGQGDHKVALLLGL